VIIAIDGPSAAGKSTVAQELARRLGSRYLDSGLTYRALAWAALEKEINPDNQSALEDLARTVKVSLDYSTGALAVRVDGRDVTALLRMPEIAETASAISRFPFVRQKMVPVQQTAAEAGKLVAEGRDMGTVVFPDAQIKFFLDARPEVRAQRRLKDRENAGIAGTLEEVLSQLKTRDNRDSTRQTSPLRPAQDALTIDTSDLNVEDVVELLLRKIHEKKVTEGMV